VVSGINGSGSPGYPSSTSNKKFSPIAFRWS
jgi:hypothetical protein